MGTKYKEKENIICEFENDWTILYLKDSYIYSIYLFFCTLPLNKSNVKLDILRSILPTLYRLNRLKLFIVEEQIWTRKHLGSSNICLGQNVAKAFWQKPCRSYVKIIDQSNPTSNLLVRIFLFGWKINLTKPNVLKPKGKAKLLGQNWIISSFTSFYKFLKNI